MYIFVFLVEMLHVGSADATARKCRCYSKEVPMLQQGSADATARKFRRYTWRFSLLLNIVPIIGAEGTYRQA